MPNGYRELRSRFYIAADNNGSPKIGHDIAVHCKIEMARESYFQLVVACLCPVTLTNLLPIVRPWRVYARAL